jgi:NAD(P)-dependent dehydrogenase (short-subunit alcohol dehydrogenase family)
MFVNYGGIDMNNKIALVTGATSGIGKATAVALALKGVTVIIGARRDQLGQQVVDEIKAKGGKAEFIKLDVSNEDNVRESIEWIVEKYGKLDYAINNAGIVTPKRETIVDTDAKDFENVLQVNVMGVFFSMKYEIQQMLKSGGGAIVNVSSINGLKATATSTPYTASKFAVQALTKSGALEVAHQNIRINSVAPGPTHSEITGSMPEMHGNFAQMIPIKRMGNPEEIANGIVWLLSDEASFVTGSTLVMDGGFIS